eukprot:Polyplicarium_translucidae@DN3282_c0_g1_i3.p1
MHLWQFFLFLVGATHAVEDPACGELQSAILNAVDWKRVTSKIARSTPESREKCDLAHLELSGGICAEFCLPRMFGTTRVKLGQCEKPEVGTCTFDLPLLNTKVVVGLTSNLEAVQWKRPNPHPVPKLQSVDGEESDDEMEEIMEHYERYRRAHGGYPSTGDL